MLEDPRLVVREAGGLANRARVKESAVAVVVSVIVLATWAAVSSALLLWVVS